MKYNLKINQVKKLLLGGAVCFAVLAGAQVDEANAQVFLKRNKDEGASSTPLILPRENSSKRSNGSGNGLFLNRKPTNPDRYSNQYKERQKSGIESGTAYSASEYNRRLLAQRRAAYEKKHQKEATNNLYPSGYGKPSADTYIVDEYTGRYMKRSEAEEMARKRDAYYKNNKNAVRKKRGYSDEAFFNEHGYYPDDERLAAGNDTRRYTKFGTTFDYDAPKSRYRDKYGKIAERYKRNSGYSGR